MIKPRNGQYELFTHNRKTHCFDDPTVGSPALVNAPDAMWQWLQSQPGAIRCNKTNNVAYYLTPETYLLWKLKWL
jgi:hypothetical protein